MGRPLHRSYVISIPSHCAGKCLEWGWGWDANIYVYTIHERVAGIALALPQSERMGELLY
jgi:hypothetical protein